jgi:RNA polymerase sigma-70 factor, ECF subfamily
MIDLENSSACDVSSVDHALLVQQLFVKHQSALRAFILSLRPDFAEAEDILQDVFLTVTRKEADFQLESSFTAWAFAIARFKVLEAQRQMRRKGAGTLSEEVIESLAAPLPEEGFFESRLEGIRECLEKLAPRAREMIRLRYHGEHTPEEIAQLLDWKPDAVNVALSKARAALRGCMERHLKEA